MSKDEIKDYKSNGQEIFAISVSKGSAIGRPKFERIHFRNYRSFAHVLDMMHVIGQALLNYTIDADVFSVEGIDLKQDDAEENINVGFQIGLGIEFWKLGIDVRYETAFSKAESAFTDSTAEAALNNFKIDNQPNQFLLGLSYKF